jgi:heterogeneous nuclear rnp K-like protein 2
LIGKGGKKIREIMNSSGSDVKIEESRVKRNEAIVNVTGTDESNQLALQLLHSSLAV